MQTPTPIGDDPCFRSFEGDIDDLLAQRGFAETQRRNPVSVHHSCPIVPRRNPVSVHHSCPIVPGTPYLIFRSSVWCPRNDSPFSCFWPVFLALARWCARSSASTTARSLRAVRSWENRPKRTHPGHAPYPNARTIWRAPTMLRRSRSLRLRRFSSLSGS